MSKREELRERRRRERTRRIVSLALVIAGFGAILTGLLILPNLTPVSDFVEIEPRPRPDAVGSAMGDPEAPVVIEIFEDFQCPACARFNEDSEAALVDEFVRTGEAYLVFRQYPFIGPDSTRAAQASMCAADQGRFWDYHDMLFANQIGENVGAFTIRRLAAYAEFLGLNLAAFEACVEGEIHQAEIEADRALGIEYGVSGTPAIFINGTQISPGFVPPYSELRTAILQALRDS